MFAIRQGQILNDHGIVFFDPSIKQYCVSERNQVSALFEGAAVRSGRVPTLQNFKLGHVR